MVEVWEIRGWSLKVQEEPLSTGSSQNESCYLILLSTLLRFICQLFDALQYAANRARIVCRCRSLFRSRYSFLSAFSFSPSVASASFIAYTYSTYTHVSIFLSTQYLARYFLTISYFLKFLNYSFFIDTIVVIMFTNKILATMVVFCIFMI